MKLQYPLFVFISIAAILLVCIVLLLINRKGSYHGGQRVANSSLVLEQPEFIRARRRHFILGLIKKIAVIVEIISIVIIIANPYKEEEVTAGVKKRDIMICMDTSFYLDDLNDEFIDALEDVIDGLDSGDRVGVTLYSSSSLTYVPLTDDFEYVKSKLDVLKEYFSLGVKLDQYYGGYVVSQGSIPSDLMDDYDADYARMEELTWIHDATSINESEKGPFLVGDGVASCLYSFPALKDEERTRIIILSTENTEAVGADPVVRLPEACELCSKYNVKLYALFRGEAAFSQAGRANNFFLSDVETDIDYKSAGDELRDCVNTTDGKFYEYGKGMTPKQIVEDIENTEAKESKEVLINKQINMPYAFVAIFLFAFAAYVTATLMMGGQFQWKK
ncbi:MAG: hypothetical protein LKG26_01660 [Saccharofermentans sp.]|nr:hypothetical protein [Mageeibacillus sp.]MCI1263750.1 hypothetical protein [Saccharofermentans sp.]MCI1274784.1 hypothetical protein [Saccharofermentans sp.]MCI1769214.1 hypothetical protein [Mageeibacillus sp.]MCI2044586.1 hypothetical protein [Mageeibacillus sp.]